MTVQCARVSRTVRVGRRNGFYRGRGVIWMWLAGMVLSGRSLSVSAQDQFGSYPPREVVSLQSVAGHGGSNSWRMKDIGSVSASGAVISTPGYSTADWKTAIVPGTVLNSLVADGVYPEPYFGTNNHHGTEAYPGELIPDISDVGAAFYTYWFTTDFSVPASFNGKQIWLQFDGINYTAEMWLNGRKLGEMEGMFNRGVFDITDAAMVGSSSNRLAVLVHPIDPPNGFVASGTTGVENYNGGDGKIGAFTTMLMTAGWDFTFKDGIRDRNTGIWRDIKLFSTGPVRLQHPFVKTVLPLPGTNSSQETISIDLVNATSLVQTGMLSVAIAENNVTVQQSVTLQPHETKQVIFDPVEYPALNFTNPRLWWPFNKGEQFLYHMTSRFIQDGTVSDQLKSRFGVRDIRSDRNTPNQDRIFYVNGRRLFLHGANWIPEAMCRTSEERTAAELRYTRQAGVNFLRLWAGGVTESDQFFDLCDELGILVWVEFWETGNTILPEDAALYRTNVVDTVQRIRNHPSLAYYVCANERNTVVPITDILTDLDGTRGMQINSESAGVHDGSPYATGNPMWYYEDTGSTRGSRIYGLCPEYGCPILPTIDGLREMMSESDLWPINKTVWDYLDGNGFHGMTRDYVKGTRQYGGSDSIDEYAMRAQMFGALSCKSIWECWSANRFEYGDRFSTGILFWYLNSPNRQTCGRMWDWSLEPTAALYFSQRANEPLHVQYDFIKNTVSVNNEFPKAFSNLTVTARILNFDMTEVYRATVPVDLPPDAFVANVLNVTLPANLTTVHFIKLTLTDGSGKVLSDNFYWRSNYPYVAGRTWTGPLFQGMSDISHMSRVALDTSVSQMVLDGENQYQVQVTNPADSPTVAFMVWLRLQGAADSKPVRPAFYDDNFFSLLPGETRTVTIAYSTNIPAASTKLVIDGWNVARRQYQSGTYSPLPDVHDYLPVSLARAGTVTASGYESSNYLPVNVIDPDVSTRWASLRTDNEWIMVDLGRAQTISAVSLAWETAYGSEYKIQVSNDSTKWTDVVHVTDGAGGYELKTFPPVNARYVRMLGIHRGTIYGYSLWDFGVYGEPNLARDSQVTASSSSTPGKNAVYAIDGDTQTRWASVSGLDNQWIMLDLGQLYSVDMVRLDWEAAYAIEYKIQVSADAVNWVDAVHVVDGTGGDEYKTFPATTARYVRMLGIRRATVYGFSLWEFEVYGLGSGAIPPPVPTGLAAFPADGQVTLKWTASATADSYHLKRSTVDGGPYSTIGTSIETNYAVTPALIGRLFNYVVSAVNAAGESGDSISVSAAALPGNLTGHLEGELDGYSISAGEVAAGQICILEASTNLVAGDWIALQTNTASGDGSLVLTDSSGTTNAFRFYRVQFE